MCVRGVKAKSRRVRQTFHLYFFIITPPQTLKTFRHNILIFFSCFILFFYFCVISIQTMYQPFCLDTLPVIELSCTTTTDSTLKDNNDIIMLEENISSIDVDTVKIEAKIETGLEPMIVEVDDGYRGVSLPGDGNSV